MKLFGKTLICFALGHEQKPWRKSREPSTETIVLVTGMGRQNARIAVERALISSRPERVLTCGFAGALNPDLRPADVLYETRLDGFAKSLEAAGARPARFLCVDRIATTAQEKEALWSRSRADAVEMESGEVHEVCRQYGVPCATLRAISDAASDNLPLDFNQLMDPQQRLHPWKLAFAILKRPHAIPALIRLGKYSALAAQQLAVVLDNAL